MFGHSHIMMSGDYRSSVLTSSSVAGLSMENVTNGIGATPSTSEYGSSMKVSFPQDSTNNLVEINC